jgi:rubrerythrin
LVNDVEAEKEAAERLLRDAYLVERDHPDIAQLLERISQEEAAHQRELVWLIARTTDPAVLGQAP